MHETIMPAMAGGRGQSPMFAKSPFVMAIQYEALREAA